MASSKKSNGIVSTIWGSPNRIKFVKTAQRAERIVQKLEASGLCGKDMSRDAIRSRIAEARINGQLIHC